MSITSDNGSAPFREQAPIKITDDPLLSGTYASIARTFHSAGVEMKFACIATSKFPRNQEDFKHPHMVSIPTIQIGTPRVTVTYGFRYFRYVD